MARGRPPKPTEQKILEGAQSCRINHDAPVAPPGRPEPPDHFSKMERDKWNELCSDLEALGMLSTCDREVLSLYCSTYQLWIRSRAELRGGLTTISAAGTAKSHPAANLVVALAQQLKGLLSELGLTPSARSRLRTGDGQGSKVDTNEDFLDGRLRVLNPPAPDYNPLKPAKKRKNA